MFRLHTSNDAARLADALGECLRAARDNPLAPARVLVPQAGLKRWLQVHLAERMGVIANVEFTPPAAFAWELLRAAQPGLPRRSPFDVEVLRWHVYALLEEPLDGSALAPLRQYLNADGDPLRRHALSLELARAYERMQGYRRERLLQWERGGAGGWQAELWRRLLARTGGVSRAARVEAWLRAFDPGHPPGEGTDKPAPPGLPPRFACFACANVSPDVLRMLAVAGHHHDVDFFLPLPSREYLGDLPRTRAGVRERLAERSGENPLLLSLGGALAEFVDLLFGYQHVQPDIEHDDYDDAIPRTTLLGRVRTDILNHRLPPAPEGRPTLPDESLQFHACHTPLREVQTLHDALLAMFEKDATLQPRDVAVMMPDVASYRPAVEAVFGGIGPDDPRFVPYNLGDAGADTLHPVAQLFLEFLDAPTSRWEADTLLDVLAVPGVMRRFDLDADAREQLARRLRKAGVRWGEDEHARADCGGYREFSWAFGIDRMLAGFACGDLDNALAGGTAPLPGVEGAASAHLDAVLAVTETWRRLRDLSRRARTARAWQHAFNETLDSLYQSDSRDLAENRALERIRAALDKLGRDCNEAEPALELPWSDVRAFLREQLARADPQQYLFTGGVTFCGMVPLRVVPFRVICLLGMDETAFPRGEPGGLDPLAADRRAGRPQKGDRDVRADDRLLFLQLLTAARDVFYVSWLGRNAHTNEPRPPSAVVAELVDVLRRHYLEPPPDVDAQRRRDAWLPRPEPLHPFDRTLFAGDAPRSFHDAWLPGARARPLGADGPAPFVAAALPHRDPAAEVALTDLKRFFENPARGFLEHALGLVLPRDSHEDADLEPLAPDDGLLRWQLTTALLQHDGTDAARQQALLRARGALPPGELATAALAIARGRADELRAAIDTFTGGEPALDDIAGTLELDDGTRIVGTVDNVHRQGLVRASAGKLNGKRALDAWIDTLFATAVNGNLVACRLFWIDKGARQRDLESVTPDAARARLAALVAAMRGGLRTPLPLFPKISWEALKRAQKNGDASAGEFLARLATAADGDDTHAQDSELRLPETRMAWRGIDLADADTGRVLYDTATALLPRLHHGKSGA